jgi:hypothetical protein
MVRPGQAVYMSPSKRRCDEVRQAKREYRCTEGTVQVVAASSNISGSGRVVECLVHKSRDLGVEADVIGKERR